MFLVNKKIKEYFFKILDFTVEDFTKNIIFNNNNKLWIIFVIYFFALNPEPELELKENGNEKLI